MGHKAQTLVSLRERFKQETTINAIGKIVIAEHLAESMFWAILLVGCVLMTYHDCEPPIRAYLNEVTVSVVELVTNKTIDFPGATLCVNVPLQMLNARNISRLTDNTTLQHFSDCLHSDGCAKRGEFYGDFYDEIVATMKVISSYVVAEVGKKTQINATNAVAFDVPDSFYLFLLETNLSVEQLIDRVAFAVCTRMTFEIESWHQTHGNKSFDFCNTTMWTWFGVPPDTSDSNEEACYSVQEFTRFQSPEDSYVFSFFPERLASAEEQPIDERKQAFFFDTYLDLANEASSTDMSASFVTVQYRQCTRVQATIAFRAHSLPKRRRPCSTTRSHFECRGYCRVSALRDTCNCTSVSWLKALEYDEHPAPSCFSAFSPAEFATRAYAAKKVDSAEACRSRCDTEGVSCEQTLITFTSMPCNMPERYRNWSMTIELSMSRFSYVSCEESLSMDLPSLMSAIGGVLGLWLEAGFIGVVHLLVFPIVTAAEWLLGRKPKGTLSSVDVEADLAEVKARLAVLESLLAKSVPTREAGEVGRAYRGQEAHGHGETSQSMCVYPHELPRCHTLPRRHTTGLL